MATESPIRIMESSGKRLPNRSGSAPPSMEGSFAAIENLIFRHKIAAKASLATPNRATDMCDPEEQLRSDPSYFAYYWAHVNLNPRLPPPLISDENQHLFSTGNSKRFTSFDDSSNVSFRLSQINLSTHTEESDDDPSPEKEDSYKHESVEEADNHDGDDDVSTSAVTNPHVSHIKKENSSSYPDRFQLHVSHTQMVSQSQTYGQTPANFSPEVQRVLHSSGFTPPHYTSGSPYMMSANHMYPNMMPAGYYSQQYTINGYAFNPPPISPYVSGYLPTSPVPMPFDANTFIGPSQTSGVNLQHLNKFYGHLGLPIQPSLQESFHLSNQEDYITPKQQSLGILGHINVNFGSPRNMGVLQFPNSPVPGSPIGGRNGIRSPPGSYGNLVFKDPKAYSLLEELKSGKGRRFELSDISGHIFEFCADQHGSRFIQQKLESCRIEEKESVFKEVLPNASSLITDVFGNYVIQKFFEYGSAEQRRELANRLEGQILPLSLQMYGCRVIQKALDAIELEQKIKLVHELDGHVLRCVRDQNGNHVIQKCIESIPTEKIKFVISSFRGQVAALSTHPYGCRVIQRVLEHSTDELQSQFIVDEILESVYTLAQDQYGNYVTQHVLERGRPEERSEIVHKLSGHMVQLSQHKFASNVIEKCLEYGDYTARGILIEEIIGLGDSSDNLLAMVKDQFANYVIQKVLQTCTGDQREVLLGRIKVHLNSLKKYTYGKHIVARFE